MENLKVDGLKPECEGCKFIDIEEENSLALELYDLACPWGELDLLEPVFESYNIRGSRRKIFITKIVTIHRLIKKHYAEKQNTD